MYRTRRVTPRRIEAALAELRGEEPDAAGGGKQEARRDGLIAAADFAVYLREWRERYAKPRAGRRGCPTLQQCCTPSSCPGALGS